jgi:hypothetical protein
MIGFPNNGYISQLNGEATYVFDGGIVNGRATGQIPPNLKWEQAKKLDIGLDMNLFNNKVNIVADYFVDTRVDLLIPGIPVSNSWSSSTWSILTDYKCRYGKK